MKPTIIFLEKTVFVREIKISLIEYGHSQTKLNHKCKSFTTCTNPNCFMSGCRELLLTKQH